MTEAYKSIIKDRVEGKTGTALTRGLRDIQIYAECERERGDVELAEEIMVYAKQMLNEKGT